MSDNTKNQILVVEDDEMIRSFVSLHLESNGFDVTDIETGKELFEMLGQRTFDLIVLDLNLPDGDGLDFAREVRKQYKTPIIIASIRKGINDRLTALDLGSVDYVTKPYDPQELLLRIRNLLQLSGAASPPPAEAVAPGGKNKEMIIASVRIAILLVAIIGTGWYFATPDSSTVEPVKSVEKQTPVAQPAPEPATPPRELAKLPVIKPDKDVAVIICKPIPDVEWWANKSHASVIGYVKRKYKGDWRPYIKNWENRLKKLRDIQARESSAIASGGIVLKGEELNDYLEKVTLRVEVIKCLAESNTP